jgi:tripartite-type tricarboxylate transporter receptor subunit TctC
MTKLITRRSLLHSSGGALAGLVVADAALGQGSFPTRPIRWICFQAAGGTMDLTMRATQPALELLGVRTQLAYVEGGAGNIARTQLYHSPPDGYSLLMDATPAEVLGEFVPGAAFKATEFEPVYGWSIEGYHLCVKKDSPIRTFGDLLALSKQRPVKVASIGRAASSHLQLLMLKDATGIRMDIVHFDGSAKSYQQVIGGNIDASIGGPASGRQSADYLHFIVVFRPEREPVLPDVPTMKEQGFDVPYISQVWYTYAAPKTPADRLDKLEAAFAKALATPAAIEAQSRAGFTRLRQIGRAELRDIRQKSYELANAYKAELLANG